MVNPILPIARTDKLLSVALPLMDPSYEYRIGLGCYVRRSREA